MKLLPVNEPPKIKLSQRTANLLVELYHEMFRVHNQQLKFTHHKYDVITYGVHAGILPDFSDREYSCYGYMRDDMSNAINLPKKTLSDEFVVADFVLGGQGDCFSSGEFLQLAPGRQLTKSLDELMIDDYISELTANDACIRIAGVLDRAGYCVKDLPTVPLTLG